MVGPSYWIDPKSGNNYMVTVQYANNLINDMRCRISIISLSVAFIQLDIAHAAGSPSLQRFA